MEKKQLISVVKPLIAAALLFGSSGGVAWGQSYTSNNGGTPHTIASPSNHGNDSWYILIQGHREASWWDRGGHWSGGTALLLPTISNPHSESPSSPGQYWCSSTSSNVNYSYHSNGYWTPHYPSCQVGVTTYNGGNLDPNGHYQQGNGSYQASSCSDAGDASGSAQTAAQTWLNAVPDVYFTVPANNAAYNEYTTINYYNRFAYGLVMHKATWGWQNGWDKSSFPWEGSGSSSSYTNPFGSNCGRGYSRTYGKDIYPTYDQDSQTRNNTQTKSIIVISSNASVRLRGNNGSPTGLKTIEKLASNPGTGNQNQLVIPGTGAYAVRFDYKYDGKNGVSLVPTANGTDATGDWPDVKASQVLGFWEGYAASTDVKFQDNSTLLLGDATTGQAKFKMTTTTGANGLNVFNYWTNEDSLGRLPDNNFTLIPDKHGLYYDIPHTNIDHTGTGVYLIKNENSGGNGCDNLGWIHVTQDLENNYVKGSGGKFFIEANGHIQLDKGINMTTVSGAHHERVVSAHSFIKSLQGITWKGNNGGLLNIYAQGPYTAPLQHCGYVGIAGNVTTEMTGGGLSSGSGAIGVLKNQFTPANTNLAKLTNCSNGNTIAAYGDLGTTVQTAIRSDNDSVHITGNLNHKAVDGALWIQGGRQVRVSGTTDIDYTTGTGDVAIRSVGGAVVFGGAFTYKGKVTTDLLIDGGAGVYFNAGSLIDYTAADATAHIGIQSNGGSIVFSGAPFNFKSHSTGKTQLWAGTHITSTAAAPLTFTYEKKDSVQDIDWYAGRNIDLSGTLTFNHNDAADHTGFIKLRANTNEAVLWNDNSGNPTGRPGVGICPNKCENSTNGNIFLRNNVAVNYWGKENVWMAANYDIHVQRNYTHIAGGSGQDPQGFTRFVAGHDIVTGEAGVMAGTTGSTFGYLHMGEKKGHFDMKAKNDIITHNHVKIGYNAAAKDALNTTLFACNNIDFRNSFWYADSSGTPNTNKWVRLYANQDILSNRYCLGYGAPVNFYTNDNTKTEWNAGRNIITSDSVNFRYGDTGNKVGPLSIIAQGGNIEMNRWTNINYDSKERILISAERNKPYSQALLANLAVLAGANPNSTLDIPRYLSDGHIFFNDSMNITRNNANSSSEDGVTDIYADYHIRTAMMNITNTDQANRNKTTIESHKGDIWLGYSVLPYTCATPGQTSIGYDKNLFHYKDAANTDVQSLKIRAGYQDQANTGRYGGGNIYIAQMKGETTINGTTNTDITIPFSNEYFCGSAWSGGLLHNRRVDTMMMYEHAGIIFGLGHCGKDKDIDSYKPGIPKLDVIPYITKRSLTYLGNKGNLTVDAGTRGNIIINRGAYLNFQDPSSTGNATFRTRFGDIDMREPFNVDSMVGSLLFLAQIENINDLSKVKFCGCEEERNNVYLQDFQYRARAASGSVFVGADNNIKLNYGGLQNIGTRHDPFLSKDYTPCPDGGQQKIGYGYNGSTCSDDLHCDADSNVNKARTFLMKFDKDTAGNAITSGGFGAVASDYIDVYRKFEYYGGNGSGMSSVPGTGTLHGENVAGYGLFMKTQANKGNWDYNIFEKTPDCPTPCDGSSCSHDYLHMVSRMTFHDDAYIEAHNQKVMLWSPVVETFGLMTLNTEKDAGGNTEITLKADSLIFHDDFIKKGNHVKLSTWSGLHKDLPIMKFGHMRKTPPFIEAKRSDCQTYTECVPCYRYIRFSKDPLHMLDTITIKFGDGAYLERLNTVVFDHTVLTCLTDSFDHVKGGEVQNAQIFTDTFKIRHQVDLFADEKHERDAHLELISEEQMGSKDYAGIYTKHLHMEPIGACGTPYSELWTSDDLALDVITTSIFGGFGFIHSDVHVENGAHLNAGFTSLRLKGMCYEQMCGTQRMKDLRLDVGAQLHFSVGTTKGLNGEYSDAIEVDRLTTYGSVDVNIEIRPCEKMEKRCYPIIYYKSVTPNSLNQLKLNPRRVVIDGEEYPLHLNIGTDGVVYVCVGDEVPPPLTHTVTIPNVSGVTTDPGAGIWPTPARGNFKFKATFSGSKPLAVRTNRTVNGAPELLTGTKNANGEYEYIVPNVQQEITLSIGPDYVSNQLLAGTAVWSHGEMIYIRVDRADIASIYSVAGQLVRKVDLPEGDTSIPMSRGAYVITLKDGSVHKVIVK